MRKQSSSSSTHSEAGLAFLTLICLAASARSEPPYLPSPVIQEIVWAPADRFVLMRVPKDWITERGAWEFFDRRNGTREAVWTADIDRRRELHLVFSGDDAFCVRKATLVPASQESKGP